MDSKTLGLKSIAAHERNHKGNVELANILDAVAAENERLRRDLQFVALWCYRDSKISDSERLSAIKYHPSVKAAFEQNGDNDAVPR